MGGVGGGIILRFLAESLVGVVECLVVMRGVNDVVECTRMRRTRRMREKQYIVCGASSTPELDFDDVDAALPEAVLWQVKSASKERHRADLQTK